MCGTHYGRNDKTDKRNVLREFLKNENENYRPIILEDNFIFNIETIYIAINRKCRQIPTRLNKIGCSTQVKQPIVVKITEDG